VYRRSHDAKGISWALCFMLDSLGFIPNMLEVTEGFYLKE
jgi:hypothetical protein